MSSSSTKSSTPTSSHTGTSPSNSSPATTSSHKSNHAVAIGVGVAVPVAVIIAAIVGFFFWRRRKNFQPEPPPVASPILELGGDSSYAAVKGNGNSAAALGRVSQMSQSPSELSSEQNMSPSTSPRNTRSVFERKPVPVPATPVGELPTHWEQPGP